MSNEKELDEFHKDHPWPEKEGIESLFRFSSFDEKKLSRISTLFIDLKLYHSLPVDFNDPFECKPHFNWPKIPGKIRAIREHLIKVAKKNGLKRKQAETLISNQMSRPNFMQETITDATMKSFSELRICCFTTKKENLLFWSHYGNSHKGFCVEFDATKMPIAYAFKVKYENEYPEIGYPRPRDARGFKPALIKSKSWEYEEEFRTIFVPNIERQPKNDGSSLILNGDEINNVYFGAKMLEEHKVKLLKIIECGPFRPEIWDTKLSKSDFKLEFKKYVKSKA